MTDTYNLERFVRAQSQVYQEVLHELEEGRKRSHWMWYIFPQLKGLGSSGTAQKYAISCREEAAAYEAHDVLGRRLRQCTELVVKIEGRSLEAIFGCPDNLKFRSSMTLFLLSVEDKKLFEDALQKYCDGVPDPRTVDLLNER